MKLTQYSDEELIEDFEDVAEEMQRRGFIE
jgi:hypothetical protein